MKAVALALAAVLGLAGCMSDSRATETVDAVAGPPPVSTPVSAPVGASGAPAQVTDKAACEASGGSWTRQGRMQAYMCVTGYADAGKACTDGDQCQGDCRLSPEDRPTSGTATGQCQANSVPFGCFTRVENGRAAQTLCVD